MKESESKKKLDQLSANPSLMKKNNPPSLPPNKYSLRNNHQYNNSLRNTGLNNNLLRNKPLNSTLL